MAMSVTSSSIISWLEEWAPLDTAEAWDNSGLQVGDPSQPVQKVLLSLDVTEAVVAEAVATGSQMIISHHPLLFRPCRQIRTDTAEGRVLAELLRNHLCVYAAHTNLDVADGGVNDALAEKIGLRRCVPLRKHDESLLKVIVFVPPTHAERVWSAMSAAGAGHIGNYSHCSFRTSGTGTFLPLPGAQPFSGKVGQLSQDDEIRVETVVKARAGSAVLKAMLASHPYEEPAYDVIPLQNTLSRGGLGRMGELAAPMELPALVSLLKVALQASSIRVAGAFAGTVSRVAVCGGAGADLAGDAVRCGAQVFVTGDMKYHEAQTAVTQGLCVLDAGHYATEFPVLDVLQDRLRSHAKIVGWDCAFEVATAQRDIFSSIL